MKIFSAEFRQPPSPDDAPILQRLQGLHRSWPGVADPRVLAAIAEVLCQQVAHRKWRVIADPTPDVSAPESFFIRSDGTPGILIGEAEPVFENHGLLWGKLELRGMSQPPDPRTRENPAAWQKR